MTKTMLGFRIAAIVVVVTAVTAGAARADALSGEQFVADRAAIGDTSVLLADYSCDTATSSTFDVSVNGIATGPYPGTFKETIHVTLGPQKLAPFDPILGDIPSGPLLSLRSSFAIKSPFGSISGKTWLTRPTRGVSGTCSEPFFAFHAACLYETFDEVEAPLRYLARVDGMPASSIGGADLALSAFVPCTGVQGGSLLQRFD